MNSKMKFFTLILVLVAASVASFLLIFQQGLVGGLAIASLFLLVCLVLFVLSVYGVVTDRFEFMGFRTVREHIGLMIFYFSVNRSRLFCSCQLFCGIHSRRQ
ncbi:hypothetical protein FK545_14840 [Planococcus glaciei]|nr:hypothetical protein [Planococcus glaciei]QDY46184.1 hypothetical protein FK545_14840 [Planococcus glaciei]